METGCGDWCFELVLEVNSCMKFGCKWSGMKASEVRFATFLLLLLLLFLFLVVVVVVVAVAGHIIL